MDPEPGAASESEMEIKRNPEQSSLIIAVTEKLPVLRLEGETKKIADKRDVRVFRKDQVLQPAPLYADYEDVPAAARKKGKRPMSAMMSPQPVGDRGTGKVHT
jgi:hypothetical protein